MIVLVCGGRDYGVTTLGRGAPTEELEKAQWRARQQVDFLRNTLTRLHKAEGKTGPFTQVIQGGAKGADMQAHIWASQNRIRCRTFKANWQKHGRAAGHIRNRAMLEEGKPELVVAFPGGKGTADMVAQAEQANIAVLKFKEP